MQNRILHVEDNPDDVLLTQLAFRKAGLSVRLDNAADGETAISMLEACKQGTPPDCVLLDIKLPGKSGLDVLAWVREQAGLRRMPVVMLSSSVLAEDIDKAYDLGANSYLLKPSELEALMTLAKTVHTYWLQTNIPPRVSPQTQAPVAKVLA